jgi:hypothetical protein
LLATPHTWAGTQSDGNFECLEELMYGEKRYLLRASAELEAWRRDSVPYRRVDAKDR